MATIAFNYLDTQGIFYVCAAVSAASIPITLLFLCDLGKMDLIENDRYLEMILTGRVWPVTGKQSRDLTAGTYTFLINTCRRPSTKAR